MHDHPPSVGAHNPMGSMVRPFMGSVTRRRGAHAAGAALVLAVATVSACSRTGPESANPAPTSADAASSWMVDVGSVPSPAAPGSGYPQLTVSDRGVMLSWVESVGFITTSLKFAERTASGWTAPLTVASGDDWFVSYADPPTVMRRSDGTLVAAWLVLTDLVFEASDLQLSYSSDNGRSWAPTFTPHHDGTRTQHAFASLFELPDLGLGLVWLDGRASALDTTGLEDGTMSVRYASFDAGWKQTADLAVDSRVCECCPTSVAVTSDGVLTAYRDRSDEEIRDIYVRRLDNGTWTDGTPVHEDNWAIVACPVNGPMLSARGRQVAAAWFTVKDDQGQAYAAFSNDAGRTWGAPIRLDSRGSFGRVDIELLDDGSAVATWVEIADGGAQFEMRRVDPSGARSSPIAVAAVSGSLTSSFPRMARHEDQLVFAWTESDADATQHVRTAVASLRTR